MQEQVQRYRFGSFELDAHSGELRKSGLRIKLEDQPFRLLTAMVSRPGEVLTREELQSALWPEDTYVEFDRGLTRAINKVRAALGDTATNPRFVETLPRRGYRFVAPVATLPGESVPPPPAEPVPAVEVAILEKRPNWLAGAGIAVLAAAVGISAYFVLRTDNSRPITAIAVLPLTNTSGDSAQDYVADGMTEQVISALSGIQSIHTVARTSAMRYKGRQMPLPEIARELHVQALVEGSIAVAGPRFRMNVRLVRIPDEKVIWTSSYYRETGDMNSLQTELAMNIASGIGAFVSPQEQNRLALKGRPVNPDVHALYLQGRVFVNETSRDSILRGLAALEQIVAKDPGNAAAWAAISDGWFGLSSVYLPPREAMPKARAAATKALSLDPQSDAAHSALGLVQVFYDWDWRAAEDHFQKAIAINPNSSTAYRGMGFLKEAVGQPAAAAQAVERAIELDPVSLWAHMQKSILLTCRRKYRDSERHARQVLAWEPRFGVLRALLGTNLAERGMFPEAILELEKAVEYQRVPTTMAWLAQGYARAGRKKEADRAMTELVSLAKTQYVCPFEVATAFAVLGRNDEAFEWMNKTVEERADCSIWLRSEPWLAHIHGDPRYKSLVRQIGFPE